MSRRLTVHKTKTPNSLLQWHKARNPLAVVRNFILVSLSKPMPSLSVKRWLLRRTGMKIGKNVSIGLGAMFDIFWPELITLQDNCMLGYNTTILCHEFLQKEYRTGPVVVGKNVMVGANCTILAGTTINDNATVSSCSLVNSDIPKGTFVGGVPAKLLRRANPPKR